MSTCVTWMCSALPPWPSRDPVAAIATNKLQGAAGTLSATAAFARRGLISWRAALPVALAATLASVAGALSIGLLSRAALDALVPVLLVAIALYFALARRMNDHDARARLSPVAFAGIFTPAVGFYD